MALLPASYPSIPYLGAIPGGLHHGLMIRINGEMLHHGRFDVEIKTGPILHPSDDINMHMSVRPDEHAIVRNHLVHQSWGPEERFNGCPINYGQPFEILILAEVDQFKIAVNGRHFCEFRHRIPLSTARFVHVNGQVKIFSIKLEGDPGTVVTPSAPALSSMTTSMSSMPSMPYQSPPQPYHQSYQPPPYPQYPPNQQYPPNPQYPQQQQVHYGSMSSSMSAVPSATGQPSYPSGQYYQPQQQYYQQQQQQNLSSQPYQQYPSYHTYTTAQPTFISSAPKSSMGTTALKYGAAFGAAGIGAYAISQIFDSGSDSD